MRTRSLVFAGLAVVAVAGGVVLFAPRVAHTTAIGTTTVTSAPPPAPPPPEPTSSEWCGEGVASWPGDVCHIDGRQGGERKTLVIWLHGVIGKNTHWSQDHVKMLTRVAKETKIELLFPKGILGEQVYGWPGTAEAQAANEEALIAQWMGTRKLVEQREGKPFGETFVFGFSSGAYFASSLALRGRIADVDGYAVLCGGQPMAAEPPARVAPVFIGVCADDGTTAAHSRAYAGSLAAAGVPRLVDEEAVSHDLSPDHFLHALAYLRRSKD